MDKNEKDLLGNVLTSEIKNTDKRSTCRYDYPFDDCSSGRSYKIDLLVTKNDGIQEAYLFCGYYEYQLKKNALLKQLRLYKRKLDQNGITAGVFLAFIDEYGPLKVLSLQDLEQEVSDNTSVFISVTSFVDYYNKIKGIVALHSSNGLNYSYFFRGQCNNSYEPIPSIFRDKNIGAESRLYHEAIRKLPQEFPDGMSTFDKLVKMQHYELPTRLLDVTTNPLVALYFACQESKNSDGTEADGEVLIYPISQNDIKYYDSDSVCILSNLAKRDKNFSYADKDILVYDIKKENPGFEGRLLKREDLDRVLCVLPKLNNDRIIKQDGAFFIFGMGFLKDEPSSMLGLPDIINIKADAKQTILNELKLMGITNDTLFPETDKIMKQIKREPTRFLETL